MSALQELLALPLSQRQEVVRELQASFGAAANLIRIGDWEFSSEVLEQDRLDEITVAGHRVGLFSILSTLRDDGSVDRVFETYPTIDRALILNLLQFYFEHAEKLDAWCDEQTAELKRQEANYTPSPAAMRLSELVRARHGQGQGC